MGEQTPGPWRVADDRGQIVSACKGWPSRWVAKAQGQETKAERAANASLIAAAPDLRQALQNALGIIVEFGDLNGFRNCSDEELGRLVKAVAVDAANALAKADPPPHRELGKT